MHITLLNNTFSGGGEIKITREAWNSKNRNICQPAKFYMNGLGENLSPKPIALITMKTGQKKN